MAAAMVKVVAEMPWPAHGDTTENPTPIPNAIRTNVMAMLAVAPARMAFQLTAESASSLIRFPVCVIIVPSLLTGGIIHAWQRHNRCKEQWFRPKILGDRRAARRAGNFCRG